MKTWVETAVHFVEMSAIVTYGDPFAQLLQKIRTRQSLSFMAVISLMWFCCSQLEFMTVRYKLLVSTIAQKLILLNQQTREFIAPSRSCVVCVDRLHRARDNQDQQRLDQEEEKNGEAKNDDLQCYSITRTMALLYLYYCKFASCLPKPSKTKEFLFASCYTEAPADVFTKTAEYYTEAARYFSAPIYTTTTEAAKYYAVPTCYTKAALSCYVEQLYYTDVPIYYTTTYATPSYNTAAPKYYTEEAAYNYVRCLVYCIDEIKYCPAPNYYQT
ncbi:hypothetical protein DAPPUDRAFT_234700 [Daphnia pulex]|uniref:Uncharacterized protein n=1 Tax=Daphnia pulex TaxID=6669 RepID=E9FX79_DAPPU|nr:hypothetical protein DAPPUDRAFT_234700 [Daphnia pulex]|eukprot:EFX88033.1 hypothetical protein DAPPUDRAFT_234700 [Daphnia pulex]